MHQRQASSYGRKFIYGKLHPVIIDDLPERGSVGLIPPEFDDIPGGEIEIVENATLMSESKHPRE